ncbi:MAG: hypothetical protein B0D92_07930 [Spirochaeta sp. LUC14_002_19_P3]|nr:MAG: hypothetical protein B0D92_07930 [Spirochaeta sp. LUC14_002_19_P3]
MTENTTIARLYSGISKVFKGKQELIEKILAAFISGGHLLIEDLPGTGKTILCRTLAQLIQGSEFKRVQFTPDLLPYDITGVEIWDESTRTFEFRPGPVFANILLADEINRSTPKVQSALLEAMAEAQVTIGAQTRTLSSLFLVIATQNPVETEGTYPLPEAQKDRFMLRLKPGYPNRNTEYAIVTDNPSRQTLPTLQPVCTMEELAALKELTRSIHIDPRIIRCAVDIAAALREHPDTTLGVSTRGALMLADAMRGLALIKGRDYVIDQDLADLAIEAYAHRLRLRGGAADAEALTADCANKEIRRIRHA